MRAFKDVGSAVALQHGDLPPPWITDEPDEHGTHVPLTGDALREKLTKSVVAAVRVAIDGIEASLRAYDPACEVVIPHLEAVRHPVSLQWKGGGELKSQSWLQMVGEIARDMITHLVEVGCCPEVIEFPGDLQFVDSVAARLPLEVRHEAAAVARALRGPDQRHEVPRRGAAEAASPGTRTAHPLEAILGDDLLRTDGPTKPRECLRELLRRYDGRPETEVSSKELLDLGFSNVEPNIPASLDRPKRVYESVCDAVPAARRYLVTRSTMVGVLGPALILLREIKRKSADRKPTQRRPRRH